MNEAEFLALLAAGRWIVSQVPIWAADLRAKGELTAEGEAAYQAHQAAVYARPSAHPEQTQPDATKPDL